MKRWVIFFAALAIALLLFLLFSCSAGSPRLAAPTPSAYLPITTNANVPVPAGGLLQPADLHYAGAFRLPDAGERPLTFEYGGAAMTFNPDGDPTGPADGFSGSLFVMGHDRLAYGEMRMGTRWQNWVSPRRLPRPT